MRAAIKFGLIIVGLTVATLAGAQEAPNLATLPMSLTYVPGSTISLLSASSTQPAPGIRVGSFIVSADASTSVSYDNNVKSQPSSKTSSWFSTVDGRVQAASDWSQHGLAVFARGAASFYEASSEDSQAASVGATGLIDVYRDLWVRFGGVYNFDFERRGSGDSFGSLLEPIDTQNFGGNTTVHKSFNRLWVEGGVSANRTTYDPARVRVLGAVTLVDQSFRDGTVYDYTGRVGYEFSPKTSIYLEGGYNRRAFGDSVFDADGHRELIGLRYEFTRMLSSHVSVGHMHYGSNGGLNDVDTWSYHANVGWSVSPLMTISLSGGRDLASPSKLVADSNRIVTDVGVRVDYAIKRDLSVHAGIGAGRVNYVDVARNEDMLYANFGVDYFWLPWASLWAQYNFEKVTTSSVVDEDFTKSIVTAGVRVRY